VFGKLLDLGAGSQNDERWREGTNSFLLRFTFRATISYNRDDRLVGGWAVCWTLLWSTLRGTVLRLSDLSRCVSNLFAPGRRGVVKVDYAASMVRLRFDLDPLRCFGLGSLGRR
jgi:hypothetical protein